MKKLPKYTIATIIFIIVCILSFVGKVILIGPDLFFLFRGDPFSYDSFTDSRDNQTYKSVKIGEQIWMAENLRFKTENSICFLEDERECSKGRFYPITDAKEISIGYNSISLYEDKKICPNGWHLPNTKETSILINELTKQSGNRYYDSNSPINIFWGKGLGYYKDSEFKDGIGQIIAGYWLLSDGKYMRNYGGDQRINKLYLQIAQSKFNIRCIADKNEK